MSKKKWWQSKTLWFNAVTVVVYIAQNLSGVSWVSSEVLLTILAVGNGILRWMTTKGIK